MIARYAEPKPSGPVHTPDGSPCGLLNHLANSCKPVVEPCEEGAAEAVALALAAMGAEAGNESL